MRRTTSSRPLHARSKAVLHGSTLLAGSGGSAEDIPITSRPYPLARILPAALAMLCLLLAILFTTARATPAPTAPATPNLVMAGSSFVASAPLPMQSPPVPDHRRVLHLWVDPIYGNDSMAVTYNPNSVTQCSQTPTEPNDYLDLNYNPAPVLLHDPFPFKTVTAAVNQVPTLPYTSTATGIVWEFAIIHCLPGMYAEGLEASYYPVDPSTSIKHYVHNGLVPNGESFPIVLPERVSIQGTSTLNTIFHLENRGSTNQGTGVPAFVFGASVGGHSAATGAWSFIDGISIFGAEGDDDEGLTPIQQSMSEAAIYCGVEVKCKPTIANCWIFGNTVGLLLDAPPFDEEPETWHTPVVINNTFAWNRVGVWNGQSYYFFNPGTSVGHSRPILINNIFDATLPPLAPTPGEIALPLGWLPWGTSAFEGIAREDLTISSPAAAVGDFNAYEQRGVGGGVAGAGGFNHGFPLAALPVTNVLGTLTGVWTNVGINLSPITGNLLWPNSRRGTLYVSDCINNGRLVTGSPFERVWSYLGNQIPSRQSFWDVGIGDFRLCPSAAPYTSGIPVPPPVPPGGASGFLNPLVDRGACPHPDGQTAPQLPFTMQNGQVLTWRPGSLSMGSPFPYWPFDSWDTDCEKFGNPRIWDHPVYTNGGTAGGIDVGADELGSLVIGGKRFGTTYFMRLVSQAQLPFSVPQMENRFLWLFGPAQAGSFTTAVLPYHRIYALTNPADTWKQPWLFDVGSQYYYPAVYRIMPHLYADIHPHWIIGGIASNPIWPHCHPSYNLSLFWNPGFGVINPPGAYPGVSGSPWVWLDYTGTAPQFSIFGPFGDGTSCTGTPQFQAPLPIYDQFDTWCVGRRSTHCTGTHWLPSTIESQVLMGKRYSVESPDSGPDWIKLPANRNLQSFMLIIEDEGQ